MTARPTSNLRRVQWRTTVLATGTVLVVLVLGAVGLVRAFESQQVRAVDGRLESTARGLQNVSVDRLVSEASPDMRGAIGDSIVQLVDGDGEVLFGSATIEGQPAMRRVDGPDSDPIGASVDGVGEVRVVAIPFGGRWILLAEPLDEVDRAVDDLTGALAVGVPLLTALLGLLVWFVVGRTLRPVRAGMERERALVADVSHELRTPLATARALLESESTVPVEIELNRIEALAVLHRLEVMVEDLLVDARIAEDGQHQGQLVDLDDVVLRAVTATSTTRGTEIDASRVSAGQVRGTEADLERVVLNLLGNAVRHSDSLVRVALSEDAGSVVLTVADDGAGLAAEDRERVFERFTRLDESRTADGAGAGLGLTIARSVVRAHGGRIFARSSDVGGAEFVVELPAAVVSTAEDGRS